MNRPRISRRAKAAVAATCFALGASVALAQDKSRSGDDDASQSIELTTCSYVGCPDGNRLCGSVSWETTLWLYAGPFFPPIPWDFTQSHMCYERGTLQ